MGGVCTIAGRPGPACTDNFQIVRPPFEVAGHRFYSAEQAYQASKFLPGSEQFKAVADAEPGELSDEEFGLKVWWIGNTWPARDRWDEIKVKTMYVANLCKFIQSPLLAEELLATRGKLEAAPSTWRWQFFNSQIMTKLRQLLKDQACLRSELERVTSLGGLAVQRELELYF